MSSLHTNKAGIHLTIWDDKGTTAPTPVKIKADNPGNLGAIIATCDYWEKHLQNALKHAHAQLIWFLGEKDKAEPNRVYDRASVTVGRIVNEYTLSMEGMCDPADVEYLQEIFREHLTGAINYTKTIP